MCRKRDRHRTRDRQIIEKETERWTYRKAYRYRTGDNTNRGTDRQFFMQKRDRQTQRARDRPTGRERVGGREKDKKTHTER